MILPADGFPRFFDIIQKIVATFAYFVGAFWILMNYIRNRTHVPRLQVEVKAEIVTRDLRRYLLATIQVRNLGLSIIKLPQPEAGNNEDEDKVGPAGCVLMVARLYDHESKSQPNETTWNKEDVIMFDVLEHHSSIEPGLTINQQKLVRLPDREDDAWWVRLRVLAHERSWSAVAIASPQSQPVDH